MSIDAWDEIRTAYHVARMGTVSGAAEVLGVHHATVIRHIDALEQRLTTKLFQRHARGYTATEAGQDLLQVAQATDDQFTQLVGRLKGRGDSVTGDLVVTSISSFSPLFAPILADFQKAHPEVTLRFLTGDRLFRLEYGEAHVAIRAGSPPEQLDNVVQKYLTLRIALFASETYLDANPMSERPDDDELFRQKFVGFNDDEPRAPFGRWMAEKVPESNIVFRTTDIPAMKYAVLAGAGLGFVPVWDAQNHPELVQVTDALPEWSVPVWLVTHVDLHRTAKVQSILTHLKAAAKALDEA